MNEPDKCFSMEPINEHFIHRTTNTIYYIHVLFRSVMSWIYRMYGAKILWDIVCGMVDMGEGLFKWAVTTEKENYVANPANFLSEVSDG